MSLLVANERWKRKLNHDVLPEHLGATSWADTTAIAAWQKAHGVAADGEFGRKSLAAYNELYGWKGTPGFRGTRRYKRKGPPLAIVIHDTVSHTAEGAYDTLETAENGPYSTHFFVNPDGSVFESLDPEKESGVHAAGWNDHSIGIDMVAILDPKHANAVEKKRIVSRKWSASTAAKGKVVDYTPEQKAALLHLVEALCQRFDIPTVVPAQLTGYGTKIEGLRAETFRGVLAHAQTSSKRWDGLLAAELLHAAGYEKWDPSHPGTEG